jgi:hypothetical protein
LSQKKKIKISNTTKDKIVTFKDFRPVRKLQPAFVSAVFFVSRPVGHMTKYTYIFFPRTFTCLERQFLIRRATDWLLHRHLASINVAYGHQTHSVTLAHLCKTENLRQSAQASSREMLNIFGALLQKSDCTKQQPTNKSPVQST